MSEQIILTPEEIERRLKAQGFTTDYNEVPKSTLEKAQTAFYAQNLLNQAFR